MLLGAFKYTLTHTQANGTDTTSKQPFMKHYATSIKRQHTDTQLMVTLGYIGNGLGKRKLTAVLKQQQKKHISRITVSTIAQSHNEYCTLLWFGFVWFGVLVIGMRLLWHWHSAAAAASQRVD